MYYWSGQIDPLFPLSLFYIICITITYHGWYYSLSLSLSLLPRLPLPFLNPIPSSTSLPIPSSISPPFSLPLSLSLPLSSSLHYKEYLVNIINKNGLDPVTIYELGQIKAMLTREEMAVPEQEDDEEDQQYRDRLIQVDRRYNLI